MEFVALTDYIEDLYRDYEVMSTQEFASKTELKDFGPVIETETARPLMLLL